MYRNEIKDRVEVSRVISIVTPAPTVGRSIWLQVNRVLRPIHQRLTPYTYAICIPGSQLSCKIVEENPRIIR